MREFGLFGGDATEAPNSRFMIDYVIHPRIDLTLGMKLNRKLRMSFMVDVVQIGDVTGFGATLPVVSIDGIGPEYASDLMDNHIHILSDLASINPLLPIGNIPQVKLREFRAKARMVTGLRISLPSLEKWSDLSISRFLMESPEDLAGLVGTQDVTPAMVIQLQEELAALQIALDDIQLQRITLNDLMNP